MIIATIGSNEYLLKNLEQANTLLDILSDAKNIENTYLINKNETIIHEDRFEREIKIKIIKDRPVLTEEEANKQIQEDRTNREKA